MIDVVKLVYEPWTKRVARRVLVGRFTRDDVDGVLVAWLADRQATRHARVSV